MYTVANIKSLLAEQNACKSILDQFYAGEVMGTEAADFILANCPAHAADYPEAFKEFVEQIDEPKYIGDWTLPKGSSGSFYTAFFDLDHIIENAECSEERLNEILAEFGR